MCGTAAGCSSDAHVEKLAIQVPGGPLIQAAVLDTTATASCDPCRTDGTETIAAGQSAGNTAQGSFHLDRCVVTGGNDSGNSGNTGNG